MRNIDLNGLPIVSPNQKKLAVFGNHKVTIHHGEDEKLLPFELPRDRSIRLTKYGILVGTLEDFFYTDLLTLTTINISILGEEQNPLFRVSEHEVYRLFQDQGYGGSYANFAVDLLTDGELYLENEAVGTTRDPSMQGSGVWLKDFQGDRRECIVRTQPDIELTGIALSSDGTQGAFFDINEDCCMNIYIYDIRQ